MSLNISNSDRERSCLRYAIYKASGMSTTQARKRYGFQNISEVEKVIEDVQSIHEAITDLARIEEKALLVSCGVEVVNSSSESDISCDESEIVVDKHSTVEDVIKAIDDVPKLLETCDYNWFEVLRKVEESSVIEIDYSVSNLLYDIISTAYQISEESRILLMQSFFAYCSTEEDFHESDRIARSVNGEVISESESDYAEDIVTVSEPLSAEGKALIEKKRKQIKRNKKEE